MQSEPVSPPPMTTTCLPVARIWPRHVVAGHDACSAAAGTPSRSGCRRARGPGTGRSRGCSAPPASDTASKSREQLRRGERRRRRARRSGTSTPSARHLLHAPVDVVLLHLEVGDAVAQQAADAVGLLEEHDVVARRARAAARTQVPAGPEPTTATRFPVLRAGGCGVDPALVPALVDDGVLDRLDAHRIVVDVERAGRLAGRRAHAAGELREVVGRVQDVERRSPWCRGRRGRSSPE